MDIIYIVFFYIRYIKKVIVFLPSFGFILYFVISSRYYEYLSSFLP